MIDPGGGELDEAPARLLRPPWAEFPLRIEREEILGSLEGVTPLRFGELGKKDDPGEFTEPPFDGFPHGGVQGDEDGGCVRRHEMAPGEEGISRPRACA